MLEKISKGGRRVAPQRYLRRADIRSDDNFGVATLIGTKANRYLTHNRAQIIWQTNSRGNELVVKEALILISALLRTNIQKFRRNRIFSPFHLKKSRSKGSMVWTKTALKKRNAGSFRKDRWIRRVPRQSLQNSGAGMHRNLGPLGRQSFHGAPRRRMQQRMVARSQDARTHTRLRARANYFRDANDKRDWNQRRAQMLFKHGPKALLQPPWNDRLGNHDEDDWAAEAERPNEFLMWNN